MDTAIRFSQEFKGRMLLLALTVGLIAALSLPFTYFILSLMDEYSEAQEDSHRIARQMAEVVKDNPDFWQYNAPKFTKIFAEYREENPNSFFSETEISRIIIYNCEGKEIHKQVLAPKFLLDISVSESIKYNNRTYGYVVISESTKNVWTSTLLLQILFIIFGCLLGYGVYRYPVNIVKQAEVQIERAFENLHFLSHYDQLTQLPNRVFFQEAVTSALSAAELHGSSFAILFLDLDRFKIINDTLGHHCGDLLLKQVADRIVSLLEPKDIFARLGGDEFTIMRHETDNYQLRQLADRIIASLEEPFSIEGYEFFVTVSIGLSIYPEDGTDLATLLKHADAAMYKAKEQGKNSFQFYADVAKAPKVEYLKMERGLRKAIQEEQGIELLYQPIIKPDTGQLMGMEALMRGNSLDIGQGPIDDIITVAEETGLIIPLGDYILRTACQQLSLWFQDGMPKLYVSVNLSPQQFQQADLIDKIAQILRDTALEPDCLQLEITESLPMLNEEPAIAKMMAMRKLGVRLAIDDFGTGYSSLARVKNFPIDTIKLDKSFVFNMMTDIKVAAITNAIIAMANSLDLSVIAEGVETPEQLDYLLGQQVRAIQGYLISSPLTTDAFLNLCTQNNWYLPIKRHI